MERAVMLWICEILERGRAKVTSCYLEVNFPEIGVLCALKAIFSLEIIEVRSLGFVEAGLVIRSALRKGGLQTHSPWSYTRFPDELQSGLRKQGKRNR
jgi:hypothetical protein